MVNHDEGEDQLAASASTLESLEQLFAEVEEEISSGQEEFGEFGSTYCLEVEDLGGSPLHILYRLDNGDPETFELIAAYHHAQRLNGQAADMAAKIGRRVVICEAMEGFLFG